MAPLDGYRRMLRTGDWIRFYPLFPLVGALCAAGLSPRLLPVFVIFVLVTAYGFAVNNLADAAIDRRHAGKMAAGTNPCADGTLGRREAWLFCALLAALPLALALFMTPAGWVFTLASLAALTAYSVRPLRLKDRFGVDILCHGLMFGGLPFYAGYTLAGGAVPPLLSLPTAGALIATLVCCEALVVHEVLDYEQDAGTTPTTVVGIGRMGGVYAVAFLVALSVAALEAAAALFPLPLPVHAATFAFLVLYPVWGLRRLLPQVRSPGSRGSWP
ncbi:UbiA family prenyltransferase [Methanofollis fontis]|nr:UbiA family prenyltransferase [Methanofollis fontis]